MNEESMRYFELNLIKYNQLSVQYKHAIFCFYFYTIYNTGIIQII